MHPLQTDNPKHLSAIKRIAKLLLAGHPLFIAASFGKDSSCLLDVTLQAALSVKNQGKPVPKILVTTSDTGVENSEIVLHAESEMVKVRAFAAKHQLSVSCHVSSPYLNDGWAVKVIGGRSLPSFAHNNSDCTVDWKIKPMQRLRKKLLKQLVGDTHPIVLVGTRFSESIRRAANMSARGDNCFTPTQNKDGEWVFTAIADWESDDVWEWIGLASNKLIDGFSDFESLKRVYADSGATSCAVVNDAVTESMQAERGRCDARSGCVMCAKVSVDKSLSTMIDNDPASYGYLREANRLRNYLVKTAWDYDLRQWISRSLTPDGYLKIQPDSYSPAMCKRLLKIALSIDAEERIASMAAGLSVPRFELVPLKSLVAIDAIWSLQGMMNKPFEALQIYHEVVNKGERLFAPEITATTRQPMPAPRYFLLGDVDSSTHFMDGLRDPLLEMFEGSGCMGTRASKDGTLYLNVEQEAHFDVDLESALLVLEFELDRLLEKRQQQTALSGYRYWVGMGTISLSPHQVKMHDNLLRRTTLKHQAGMTGEDIDVKDVLAKSLTKAQYEMRLAQDAA